MPHQLTIRYDESLAREIEDRARRAGISRNQAVVRLLRRATGLEGPERAPDRIGDSLDWFIGSWTDEQARELGAATQPFEVVEQDLWE